MANSAIASRPRRRRRTPAEIRERLLAAAREAFKENGYAGARTAAIARRAEVTEAQLFRYYGSKADLFQDAVFEALNRHFSEFNDRYLDGVPGAMDIRELERLYIAEFREFVEQHGRLLLSVVAADAFTENETGGVPAIDSLRSYFERGAAMMADRVGRRTRVAPELMVRVSFAAMLGCVIFKDWLFTGVSADGAEINEAISEFLLDGIHANRGTGR